MKSQAIYDFHNYREFLKIEIEAIREQDPKLGYRGISKSIGVSSPNFILLVIQGKRNLSVESAKKLAKYLDLDADQTTFFVALVGYNQAVEQEERLNYQRQMFSVKGYLRAKPVESAQYKYFSDWSLVLLREMMGLRDFSGESKILAEQIHGEALTAKDIESGLKALAELRLVDKSLEGKFQRRDANIEIPPGLSHSFIFAFHKVMLEKSIQALLTLKPGQREISANTLTFDSSQMTQAKEFLTQMRTEFIARFGSAETSDSVCQLNYQFFELANVQKKP